MNKDLIIRVLKNKYISKIIFQYIYYYHRVILSLRDYPTYELDIQIFKWKDIIIRPFLLVGFGYLKYFREYLEKNDHIYNSNNSIISFILHSISCKKENVYRYLVDEVLVGERISVIHDFRSVYELYRKQQFSKYHTKMVSDLDIFKWFIETITDHGCNNNCDCPTNERRLDGVVRAVLFAARAGSLSIVQWLNNDLIKERTIKVTNSIWAESIKSGSVNLLEYLYQNEPFQTMFNDRCRLLEIAVEDRLGIGIMKWIVDRQDTVSLKNLIIKMVRYANGSTIEWLHKNLSPTYNREGLDAFDWLFKNANGVKGIGNIMDCAIKNRNYELVKWIHDKKPSIIGSKGILSYPIRQKDTDILHWFKENNRPESYLYNDEDLYLKLMNLNIDNK